PLRGTFRPSDFQAAADRVAASASAEFVLPTEPLFLDVATLGFGPDILGGNCSAVGFPKGVTTGNERDCLLVIHSHASKRLADVTRRSHWIRLTIRAFRIHIDQTHLHGSQRIRQIAIAAVALVGKPLAFRSPENVLFGLPCVFSPTAETEGLETHRLKGNVP